MKIFKVFIVKASALLLVSFLLSNSLAENQAETEDKYTITVSGGISLGVYLAGLNWVLVESLRNDALDENVPKADRDELVALAGASAGGVNSLASAFRYCEKKGIEDYGSLDKNLFGEIWLNTDISNLLPDLYAEKKEGQISYDTLDLHLVSQGKRVTVKDSLFTRSAVSAPLKVIKQRYLLPDIYRSGCEVDIALMVTMSDPLKVSVPTKHANYEIKLQSFVVPITFKTKTTNGRTIGVFKNNHAYGKQSEHKQLFDYLFLPEKDEIINIETIMRLSLATSAFPAAFGRVTMDYCRKPIASDSLTASDNSFCPENHKFETGDFIDGGLFNNIPVNKAVKILETKLCEGNPEKNPGCEAKNRQQHIFLHPERLRRITDSSNDGNSEKQGPMTFVKQVKSITPALNTLMSSEIYDSITENFYCPKGKTDCRNLFMTDRNNDLTGNYLTHFGAFLSPSFREYDYAVGIYDGLYFLSNKACPDESKKAICLPDKFEDYAESILALMPVQKSEPCPPLESEQYATKSRKANTCGVYNLIAKLIQQEHSGYQNNKWNDIAKRFAGYPESERLSYLNKRLLSVDNNNDLGEFINALTKKTNNNDCSPSLRPCKSYDTLFERDVFLYYILKNPEHWSNLVIKRSIDRLILLEQENKGDLVKLLKAAAVFSPSVPSQPVGKNFLFANPDIPSRPVWYRVVPDQIGIDASQTGMHLAWAGAPKYKFRTENFGLNDLDVELGFGLQLQTKDQNVGEVDWVYAGVGLRKKRYEVLFSSLGINLNVNRNISNTSQFGNELLFGAEFNIGLLSDKLRLGFGYRDVLESYRGEDFTARLSITDIDSFIYALSD